MSEKRYTIAEGGLFKWHVLDTMHTGHELMAKCYSRQGALLIADALNKANAISTLSYVPSQVDAYTTVQKAPYSP